MQSDYMPTLATLRHGSIAYREATSDDGRTAAVLLTTKALDLPDVDTPTVRRLLARGES